MEKKTEIVNNIPPFIIKLNEFSTVRGKKTRFKVGIKDEDTQFGTYIRSTIHNIKAIKMTWDNDEYYIFKSKSSGLFMLEKDVIYECKIDCSLWRDLINV